MKMRIALSVSILCSTFGLQAIAADVPFERRMPLDKQANEENKSASMRQSWKDWHDRLNAAVQERFEPIAKRAFGRTSVRLTSTVSFVVLNNRSIANIKILSKSRNVVFNSMALMILKTMNGQPVLDFPKESRRTLIEHTMEFSAGTPKQSDTIFGTAKNCFGQEDSCQLSP